MTEDRIRLDGRDGRQKPPISSGFDQRPDRAALEDGRAPAGRLCRSLVLRAREPRLISGLEQSWNAARGQEYDRPRVQL